MASTWCDSCGKGTAWRVSGGLAVCQECGFEREVDDSLKGCDRDYRGTVPCLHTDPNVFDRRGGNAYCPKCGKWVGRVFVDTTRKRRKQESGLFANDKGYYESGG